MREPRRTIWLLVCVLVAVVAGPGMAQSLAPDEARPAPPNNPFVPPPCTGTVFTDVTCSTTFDPWIEQFAADAITGGCGGGAYCPTANVTRAQMAVFVEKAMRGTAAWSPGDLGDANTGLGEQALLNKAATGGDTAVGYRALSFQSFDSGSGVWFTENTAIGLDALLHNQPTSISNGLGNTAVGAEALFWNETGSKNTAIGYYSMFNNEASSNSAFGAESLAYNQAGFDNTAIGWKAGNRGSDTITGYTGSPVMLVSTYSGSYNTFLGVSGSTADVDNCTAVGMDAYCDATDQVRLGNFYVNSIGGKVAWSALSDARAKTDIRDLDLGLPFVLALRPVSYRLKSGNDRIDMGFVGQDVEALLGDGYNVLDIGGDAEHTLSLRYSELIAPLVKAVQEQEAEIEAQKQEIEALKAQLARIGDLRAQIAALAGGRRDGSDKGGNHE